MTKRMENVLSNGWTEMQIGSYFVHHRMPSVLDLLHHRKQYFALSAPALNPPLNIVRLLPHRCPIGTTGHCCS